MEKTKLNAGRKKAKWRRNHVATLETETRTLPGKLQLRGATEMNGNGLV